MRTRKFILFLLVFWTFGLLQAQYPFESGSNEPLSVVMYADKIARGYEVRLASTLSSYCERGTYEVDVTVNLKPRQASSGQLDIVSSSSVDLFAPGIKKTLAKISP